ncbi:MAG: hypothetical protein JST40_01045 [Armatimonadetes bacterium]|nr:hypothetical protein [Armatimonadota bacterium]
MTKRNRWIAVTAAVLLMTAIATPQIKEAIKIIGVGAAVDQFGPELDRQLNKLVKHTKTEKEWTKVVPILTVGIGKSSAIGAAQVTGTKKLVDSVEAVAAPEVDLFGKEIRIRGMIPVSDKNVLKGIKRVSGVGVSGIVDLKL